MVDHPLYCQITEVTDSGQSVRLQRVLLRAGKDERHEVERCYGFELRSSSVEVSI